MLRPGGLRRFLSTQRPQWESVSSEHSRNSRGLYSGVSELLLLRSARPEGWRERFIAGCACDSPNAGTGVSAD
eukprot:13583342-Alexandrium_andersonii.AAC.1